MNRVRLSLLILLVLVFSASLANGGTNTWATGSLDGWYSWDSAGTATTNVTFPHGATPDGNTKTLRITTPSGTSSNSGLQIAGASKVISPTATEMWMQYYVYYPTAYTFHPTAEKISGWEWPSNSSNNMLTVWQYGVLTMAPQLGWHSYVEFTPNMGYSPTQQKDHWYKFLEHVKMNTAGSDDGTYELWVDDQAVMSYTNVPYRNNGDTQGFSKAKQLLVWGGQSGNITLGADMYQYRGTTILQSTTIGQPGDQTPPYVETFSPGDDATGVSQGTTSVSFHFKDYASGADNTSLTIACTTPTVATKNCGDANFACTGTSADYTATLSGLSLSYEDVVACTINGQDLATTPNAMAPYSYGFTVEPEPGPPALAVTTTTLSEGRDGTAFSATLAATGGTTPYSWSVSAGALPSGITLSSGGILSGNPSANGTFSFTVQVTDASEATDTQALSWVIAPPVFGGSGTVVITSIIDTYTNSGSAGTNYSSETSNYVYQWPYATVANRSYLRVDITSIPANSLINSAKLYLYLSGKEGSGGTNPMRVYVYPVTGSPDVTTLTWTNNSSTLGTSESYVDVTLVSGYFGFTVTSATQAAVDASASYLYLALDGGGQGAADTNRIFASVDHATTAFRPQLVVSYNEDVSITPPPAPTGHTVAAGDGQVTLTPGTSFGASSYNAYYTGDGSTPTITNGTKVTGVSAGDNVTNLTNGTSYKFGFTAVKTSVESALSTIVVATPVATPVAAPDAPTGHSVTSGNKTIRIYPGTSQGATSYNAYYTSDGSTPSKVNGTKITGATNGQRLSGLTNGTEYKFVFTAVNGTGESAESSVVSATPLSVGFINTIKAIGNGLLNLISGTANYLTK